jgi:hypothetical protein
MLNQSLYRLLRILSLALCRGSPCCRLPHAGPDLQRVEQAWPAESAMGLAQSKTCGQPLPRYQPKSRDAAWLSALLRSGGCRRGAEPRIEEDRWMFGGRTSYLRITIC